MEEIIKFIVTEKEWLFSGIGVFVLSFFISKKNKAFKTMKQDVINGSSGIQAGKNINIDIKDQ